mgnify:CR=1 FL=1
MIFKFEVYKGTCQFDTCLPAWQKASQSFPPAGGKEIKGSTAQFGKKSQTGFLPQSKVWKTKESCMYFSFFKLKKWGKKAAETRRRNCAVLP